MDKNLKLKFEEAKKDIGWHEDIVWDYNTIIKFFSHFNETGWDDKTIYRFFSKVGFPKDLENGCWIWNAGTDKDGYGEFGFKEKHKRSHRLSHEFFFGKIPEGMFILHNCDIPSCVSPFDLQIGTHHDNMYDMVNKGRSASGKQNGMYRYDKQLLIDILKKIKNGTIRGRQDILKENVSYSTINDILNGRSRQEDVGKLFDLEDLKNKLQTNKKYLTDDQVREIRVKLKNGESVSIISRQFNCNINTIYRIKNNKIYIHVKN